jgi:hypothetical protein
VVNASCEMLLRIIHLTNFGRQETPLISGTVNVKIFLASYMISSRPKHVFEAIGELEQKLFEASKPFLDCFHATARVLSEGTPWSVVSKTVAKDISGLLCTYLRTFKV